MGVGTCFLFGVSGASLGFFKTKFALAIVDVFEKERDSREVFEERF